ncbi:MAG: histidine--tRNA ligase [Kosmotoga sp.]|nr:MAG: histidine--tRNA ligase [Kosmotoga sp.]
MIRRIKGTQDIYMEEITYWHFVEEIINDLTRKYAFQEIRTPIFEATQLFKRSVGEYTDVVQKEMYTFEDKGGRSITLRPEGTASIARAYIENGFINFGSPLKLYYMGPMFRYEKPQAGRLRQFHQFGIETLGSEDPEADFEIIDFSVNFVKALGINDFQLLINSVGCEKCRPGYRKALKDYYSGKIDQICNDCKKRYETNVLRLLDCDKDKKIANEAPSIHDYLCNECSEHFKKLTQLLTENDIEYTIDKSLVRGLDYYTKTAFEIKSNTLGGQDQILGGGRYDGLIEQIGGKRVPAVGFAAGLDRIILLLRKENIVPENKEIPDIAVLAIDETAKKESFKIAECLRNKDFSVFVDVVNRNIGNKLKHASRIGAAVSIILGENEIESGEVSIKNMNTGEQNNIPLNEVYAYLRSMLNTENNDN